MPYYLPLPTATRIEQWDGENIAFMREVFGSFFDFYEIDPDTKALTANGVTFEVGTYMFNAGGSPGTVTAEDVEANWQLVNTERPRYLIDTDDLES